MASPAYESAPYRSLPSGGKIFRPMFLESSAFQTRVFNFDCLGTSFLESGIGNRNSESQILKMKICFPKSKSKIPKSENRKSEIRIRKSENVIPKSEIVKFEIEVFRKVRSVRISNSESGSGFPTSNRPIGQRWQATGTSAILPRKVPHQPAGRLQRNQPKPKSQPTAFQQFAQWLKSNSVLFTKTCDRPWLRFLPSLTHGNFLAAVSKLVVDLGWRYR